ncbi:MAG: hypothetical protein NTY33_04425 [Candidatus Moranbacteria bacterium]|nr:hypothetical protein [Candidatus Moranbacteria bacterium]
MNEWPKQKKNTQENNQSSLELEQSIIASGEKLLKEDPAKWPGFLNNFHMFVLPEENKRWRTKREQARKLGYWDKKNKETTDNPEKHSALWLEQTSEEFFETIDRVIAELDTDGEIKQAIDRFCNVTNYNERVLAQNKLDEKLILIFARLVAMGYTMRELRG